MKRIPEFCTAFSRRGRAYRGFVRPSGLNGICLLYCLLLSAASLGAQEWRSVDDASLSENARQRLTDYDVSVRTPRGEWEPVAVTGALVSDIERRTADGDNGPNGTDTLGHVRTLMGVAMFTHDFRRPVRVRVRRQGAPFRQVDIRPTSLGIRAKRVDGQTIEFRLRKPEELSIEFDDDRQHNLFLFADRPLPRPEPSDSVIYYGPGEHDAGLITLRSGQTLFIDEGAVVYGYIDVRHASHLRIMGRGILCGSRNIHDLARRRSLIYMSGCSDILIEGIYFRASPSWTLCFSHCRDLRMENIKEVCWMRNSDGIDLCNTRHVVISDSFLRNYDDNISLKNFDGSEGETTGDILMHHCTLWADCAHNLLVGPETRPHLPMDSIRFEHIEILETREPTYPWRGAMAVMGSDEGTFRHIVFHDITVDRPRGGQLFAIEFCPYNTTGRVVEDVTLSRIRFVGDELQLPLSTIRGLDANRQVDGVVLSDIRINGRRIKARNLPRYVETNGYVRNLQINP